MRRKLLLLTVASLLLAGCGVHKIPEGPQTVEGVLQPVEFSLSRRGTHHILVEDKPLYFVESHAIDLFTHENRTITITGTVEANLDPKDLPVLIVDKIIDPEAESRIWRISALQLELAVPAIWNAVIDGPRGSFTAEGGNRIPALVVFRQQKSSLSFDFATVSSTTGSSIDTSLMAYPDPLLDRRAVVKQDRGAELLSIFIDDPVSPDAVLVLRFSKQGMMGLSDLDGAIERIVKSLRLIGPVSSASSSMVSGSGAVMSGSGSMSGQPCGGTAGILCPSGSYCAITDTVNNVGRCTKL